MTDPHPVALSDQSFTASTGDGSVFVRVAVRGHVLGVQLEPEAMGRPGHEIAERIVACADVAYLQGQVALRQQFERNGVSIDGLAGIPTEDDLTAARDRLGKLS